MTDYNTYSMSITERILYTAIAAAVIFVIAYVFYRSVVLSALLTPFGLLYPRVKKRDIIEKRRKELNIQFKDMLYSLSSSLSAGKTVEAAFREAGKDLSVLYHDHSAYILVEVEGIVNKLNMNETIESALLDFAKRSGLEDVNNFANVFSICKRSGGNIAEVIKNTSSIINDRIEVGQEIDIMIAERKFEQKVLNVIPILMIVLLSASAPDYMYPIFNTAAGRLIMTVAIILLAAAWFISDKVSNIKV
jgi:tight adherence protein B